MIPSRHEGGPIREEGGALPLRRAIRQDRRRNRIGMPDHEPGGPRARRETHAAALSQFTLEDFENTSENLAPLPPPGQARGHGDPNAGEEDLREPAAMASTAVANPQRGQEAPRREGTRCPGSRRSLRPGQKVHPSEEIAIRVWTRDLPWPFTTTSWRVLLRPRPLAP